MHFSLVHHYLFPSLFLYGLFYHSHTDTDMLNRDEWGVFRNFYHCIVYCLLKIISKDAGGDSTSIPCVHQ